jgi:hypothetical protein
VWEKASTDKSRRPRGWERRLRGWERRLRGEGASATGGGSVGHGSGSVGHGSGSVGHGDGRLSPGHFLGKAGKGEVIAESGQISAPREYRQRAFARRSKLPLPGFYSKGDIGHHC